MRIKKITKLSEKAPTYDIEVDEVHNYYIKCGEHDLVSHNSSIISSSTSGLEPIRSYIVSKTSKAGKVTVIAPNIVKNKDYYSLAFDLPIEAMQKIYAAVNKFTCMSISANNYVNVAHYDNKQIPLSVVVKDTLEFFRLGGKTQYYFNTEDDSGEAESGGCSGGACSI